MKIFYISNARLPTEKAHGVAVMKTCEALAKAGHEVELIVPNRRNTLADDPFLYYDNKTKFPLRTLPTIDLPWGRFGFLLQEISFAVGTIFFLRGKEGVIYSRDYMPLYVLSLSGVNRFVWESHTGAWNAAARHVAKRATGIVVISHGLKEFYVEKGMSAGKITVIPSAIELKQFANTESKEAARKRLELPQDKKIVLYIGRLDGWKGSATLLETSKLLLPEIVVCVIGGEPYQIEELKSRYPGVLFLGFRPYAELADNQAAADVLVVPNTGKDPISARFTSPLKLIAHMASVRPIVASDLPSIREIVGDDAALLVSADDSQALAGGIRKVLADDSLGSKLAERALERVGHYTWDSRAESMGSILAGPTR